MSLRLRLLAAGIKPVMRRRMARMADPLAARRMFDRASRFVFRAPPYAHYVQTQYRSDRPRQALWVQAGAAAPDRVILYLHGGGYLAGSPWGYRKLAAHLAKAAGARVFLPRYRLAPEHRLPEALDDALAAHAHLLGLGYRPRDIVIGGDSAGGGLAFALLADLCANGQQPAGVFAWSPCVDLTYSGASVQANARRDHLFPGDRVHDLSAMVLGDVDPTDPRVSPLFATFADCPPVLLQVSDSEILYDDAVRMDARLRAAGAVSRLEVWHDAPHVWHFLCGYVPEAREAIENTGRFIRSRWAVES